MAGGSIGLYEAEYLRHGSILAVPLSGGLDSEACCLDPNSMLQPDCFLGPVWRYRALLLRTSGFLV